MKLQLSSLASEYEKALRSYLARRGVPGLGPAQGLGFRAISDGLKTLDLARVHEQCLVKLVLPSNSPISRETMVRRAGTFFARVITPIEKTHRIALETSARMGRLRQELHRRSLELARSRARLKQEKAERKLAEESLRKGRQHYGRLLDQSRQMQDQLRLLSRQLLSAQEEERKKISRELHDVIAQTLTTINVRLASLKKEAALNTKGLERSIARTQKLVERSVSIVHRFARELRPTVLDDLGLIPALHTFMKAFKEETGIQVSLSAFAELEQVNGEKRTVLYRVAQEALTNVARHAKASHAEVKIERLDGRVCMRIKDNGTGFQAEQVLRAKRGRRLGLLGMRERLEMVRGNFTVSSVPGKGTTVLATIPLTNSASSGGGIRLTHMFSGPEI